MANRQFREVDRNEFISMKLFDDQDKELENDKLPNPADSSVLYQTSEPMLLQAVPHAGNKYRAVVHTIGTPDRREAKGVIITATITDAFGRVFTARSEPFDITAGAPCTHNVSLGDYVGPRVNAPFPESSASMANKATPIAAPLSPGFHEPSPTNELPPVDEETVHPFSEKPKTPHGENEQHPSLSPESTPDKGPQKPATTTAGSPTINPKWNQ